MKSKLTILILVHPDLIPPNSVSNKKIFDLKYMPWKTEYDVITTLKEMGHEVLIYGLDNSLNALSDFLDSIYIDVVFNLMEEFNGKSQLDYKVVEFLEKKQIPFTGCSSKALLIGRDKAKSKKIVQNFGIDTPWFKVFRRGKAINLKGVDLKFPLIVKCLKEESSFGITKNSVVKSRKTLFNRINYVHQELKVDCIVEEFIEGDEVYVGNIGGVENGILPPRKLYFLKSSDPSKEIYTSTAKWSYSYAKKNKILTRHYPCNEFLYKRLIEMTKTICIALGVDAQGRVDFRINKNGKIYFLELNPNPNIAKDDDFALAAVRNFKTYSAMMTKILDIALERTEVNNQKNITNNLENKMVS